ncbi:MAG: ChbG/HpnK family deacetylase [Erysipelotrichaceae bacterium]|nr:ChbG/HpnK family deacetylase [Erysipelotrichaceae bacterium]MBQ6216704.1 ChbG/HpnK family deacetylase [Erysipelotrichaceae bacterium]
MKKILIRADDLGFSRGINLGIADSVRAGLIQSVGLMPNMENAQEGVEMIKDYGVCLGQHTNICAGRPLSDPKLIPSLVQENGEFKTSKEYRENFGNGNDIVDVNEAVIEIEAQYQEFKKLTGEKPHYFEGHAIASMNFMKALSIVAQKHDLKMFPVGFDAKPMQYADKLLRMTIDSMGPDYDPYASLKKLVMDEDESVIDIFVAHPGYLDAYILKVSSLTVNRTKEVEMLTDPEMIRWINNQKVELITYDEL